MIGENGSGKSTLIKLLGGLYESETGSIKDTWKRYFLII
ncbi:ATP-binding cassette domain-containing protein [Clostridium sp. KNHs214]